jgi:micrococcal nuclease
MGQVDLGERIINAGMVRDGLASRYPQHEFAAAEADACEHWRGLWAEPNPVPPWEWRREKRRTPKSQ